jgi:hypothetical protein
LISKGRWVARANVNLTRERRESLGVRQRAISPALTDKNPTTTPAHPALHDVDLCPNSTTSHHNSIGSVAIHTSSTSSDNVNCGGTVA